MFNDEPTTGDAAEDTTEVDCHVGWGPEGVSSDSSVPRNVPQNAQNNARCPRDDDIAMQWKGRWRNVTTALLVIQWVLQHCVSPSLASVFALVKRLCRLHFSGCV